MNKFFKCIFSVCVKNFVSNTCFYFQSDFVWNKPRECSNSAITGNYFLMMMLSKHQLNLWKMLHITWTGDYVVHGTVIILRMSQSVMYRQNGTAGIYRGQSSNPLHCVVGGSHM